MKVFITLCMVALAFGHPVKENDSGSIAISKDQKPIANERVLHKRSIQADGKLIEREDHDNAHENIIQKRDVQDFKAHSVEKRDAPVAHDIQKRHVDGQGADGGHVRQERDAQNVEGVANQNGDYQEAYSNEGAHARQGEGGQSIHASDFGGPIVQILQHVYKSNCCACGCDCGCPQEPEDGDS